VFNVSEKAYCQALMALKNKDYALASEFFDEAAPYFGNDKEFVIFRQTAKLMVAVKAERRRLKKTDGIQIEEVFSDG